MVVVQVSLITGIRRVTKTHKRLTNVLVGEPPYSNPSVQQAVVSQLGKFAREKNHAPNEKKSKRISLV